ncbi:MAG: hypothetical protein HY885_13720 [Deltaproteobacteria bacterium]|nr:hypothetical protein [Deltaproteobacteria bacterium]
MKDKIKHGKLLFQGLGKWLLANERNYNRNNRNHEIFSPKTAAPDVEFARRIVGRVLQIFKAPLNETSASAFPAAALPYPDGMPPLWHNHCYIIRHSYFAAMYQNKLLSNLKRRKKCAV